MENVSDATSTRSSNSLRAQIENVSVATSSSHILFDEHVFTSESNNCGGYGSQD